jgi:predicted RNA-binding Zn-ribbon protein involved in translation (DUF1610 family)
VYGKVSISCKRIHYIPVKKKVTTNCPGCFIFIGRCWNPSRKLG